MTIKATSIPKVGMQPILARDSLDSMERGCGHVLIGELISEQIWEGSKEEAAPARTDRKKQRGLSPRDPFSEPFMNLPRDSLQTIRMSGLNRADYFT